MQPSIERIAPNQRDQYDWQVATRAVWRGTYQGGFGDIVRVNPRTLELTNGAGPNVVVDKSLVYAIVNF